MLKALLLRRAVALVHILKPIEEERRAMHMMQMKGYLPENHYSTFHHADEMCQQELKSIMEESQVLAPESAPNDIIHSAVQLYHQGHGRPQSADSGSSGKFEDVRRGFFKNASSSKEVKKVHGFEIGAEVEAHGLKTASLNGQRGHVLAARSDRVAVAFPPPLGEKALKPENLRIPVPAPKIHPLAREPPVARFHVEIDRKSGEQLGLVLNHEPPVPQQQPGRESCLLIQDILPNGAGKRYNDSQKDPNQRLRPGDRVVAIVDRTVAEKDQKPVGGNSQAILNVIQAGSISFVFFVVRLIGPPLRFKVEQRVKANCGERGWMNGVVKDVWQHSGNDENGTGPKVPYVIAIEESGNCVFAPNDGDDCVMKGEPRFKVGDDVVANHSGKYKRGKISEVKEEPVTTSYSIKLTESDDTLTAPDDMNMYVRPIARFTTGTEVLANVSHKLVPGKIEACYHPDWVYAIRLDTGNVVTAPEDTDTFIKKR
jgi:hypothetical protein